MLDPTAQPKVGVLLKYDASAVALPRGELYVGRSSSCFLCIDDPVVSRHHLRFVIDGRRALVEDLCSTNGTLVNGKPLRGTRELADGDQIMLGSRVLHVCFVDPAAAAAAETRTPRPEIGSNALLGTGTVQLTESCPRCCSPVPIGMTTCAGCGFRWPKGSPKARTAPQNPALSMLRRRDERVDVQLDVRYESGKSRSDGVATNISRSGVFVRAAQLDPVGTDCSLRFGGDEGVVIHGFVRHVIHRGPNGLSGMGIEFNPLSDDAEGWLLGRLAAVAISAVD